MEYIDILDSTGRPTGLTKTRSEVHHDADWHRCVHVWLLNSDGELLLQKRSPEKETNPNKWTISASGHVSSGDDTLTSAIRETEEELGLLFAPADLTPLCTVTRSELEHTRSGDIQHNSFNDVFLVRKDIPISNIRMEVGEITEVKYIPWQDLEKMVAANDASLVPHHEEYGKLFVYLRTVITHQGRASDRC